MSSVRTERLPNINRGALVTTGGINPLPRPVGANAGGGGGSGVIDVDALGEGGTGDKRTLPGVGTYLIDTPKDSGLQLRQRYFTFQEQHRGAAKTQLNTLPIPPGKAGRHTQDEILPEIPFRLNPKPEASQTPAMPAKPPSILKVDMATSPMFPFDEEVSRSPSRISSPAPSTARSVTFAADVQVTSQESKEADDIKTKTANVMVREATQEAAAVAMARSVSFSERPRRKSPQRRVRECSKLNFCSPRTGTAPERIRVPTVLTLTPERLPALPDTARTNLSFDGLESARKKSLSVSDLTDVGSVYSWHDKEFEVKRSSGISIDSDNVGPTSFFQRNKSKSLLDLLRPSRGDDGRPNVKSDLNVYHKGQRISHLAFRKENSQKRRDTLSSDDADREWMNMVNTQVIPDNTEYDRYASRRKPTTPASKNRATPYTPKSGMDFRLSQPVNGKVYPVFFNDGSPPRKFGRAMYKRKTSKSKSQ